MKKWTFSSVQKNRYGDNQGHYNEGENYKNKLNPLSIIN